MRRLFCSIATERFPPGDKHPVIKFKDNFLPNSCSYTMHHGSEASLTLTRLDKAKGSKIEGTFSIDRLDYKNPSHDVVSSNHNLTDGKFKVTVNQ